MLIRLVTTKHVRHLLASATMVIAAFSVQVSHAAEAVMAPKAQRALLLDITTAGSKLVAVGERGHILVSNDEGSSWKQKPVPVDQMFNAVYFTSEKYGWAAGHDGNVVATVDGGETWTLIRPGIKAQAKLNEIAVKDANAELKRMQELLNSGTTEDPRNNPLYAGMTIEEAVEEAQWQHDSAQGKLQQAVVPSPLMDIWFKDEKTGFVVGAFGYIFKTVDGGVTWQDLRAKVGNTDNFHFNTIVGTKDGAVFAGGEAGLMVYSLDLGETWQQSDVPYEGSLFTIVSNHDASKLITTGLRGNTFVSFDRASTWVPMNTGVDYSLACGTIFEGGNVVLAGSGGTVAISLDGGQTFTSQTLASRSSISSVVATQSGKFIMVGQGGVHHFDVQQSN